MMSGKPNRVLMLPTDLWFEVIDYLRVTDIVHFRAVRYNFRDNQATAILVSDINHLGLS
jgi:hypothetical protein